MKTLVKMTFGSHLYGTATPESDRDYKGVFLPTTRDVLLGKIPKTFTDNTNRDPNQKNSPDDVDSEFYSLHYFLELALKGETVALDMLHAPRSALLETSLTWASLTSNRQRFYTRNLRSLVGYARRQAAKYGVKGGRLSDARQVLEILKAAGERTRIGELDLPTLEHGRWTAEYHEVHHPRGVRYYEICGKRLQATARAEHYVETMEKFVDEYGHRAKLAERNEGIDWKAISHALRAGYQTYYILTDRGFEYPLPETGYLVKVKRGEVPFAKAGAALEELIARVEDLSANSPLPERADRDWWERWLYNVMATEVGLDLLDHAQMELRMMGPREHAKGFLRGMP